MVFAIANLTMKRPPVELRCLAGKTGNCTLFRAPYATRPHEAYDTFGNAAQERALKVILTNA